MPVITTKTLAALARVTEGRDPREQLALEELHRGAAARAAVGDLLNSLVLLASGCSITTTNDRDCSSFSCSNHCIHESLGASLELAHLKHTHGAVPDDGLRCHDSSLVQLVGLGPTVQPQKSIWDTLLFGDSIFHLAVLTEL